jgi:anti-sigma factor RsiW
MTTTCGRVRKRLGAFLDGELSGAERVFVSEHLTECPRCAEEHHEIRDLGEMLRATAPARKI